MKFSVRVVLHAEDGTETVVREVFHLDRGPLTPDSLGLGLGEPDTPGGVRSVAFAPDGHTLATASNDGTVILWDLSHPTQPRQFGSSLIGHPSGLSSVAFAPDGHTLATGSDDGTVILWNLTGLNFLLSHAVERACAITQGGLDHDEWARRIPGLPYQDTCPA